MSGWRIVPVEATKEQLRAALLSPFGEVGRQYKAAIAAAPEPDWEELAEQIYAYYWNDYDANGSASLVRALKVTFGSKP